MLVFSEIAAFRLSRKFTKKAGIDDGGYRTGGGGPLRYCLAQPARLGAPIVIVAPHIRYPPASQTAQKKIGRRGFRLTARPAGLGTTMRRRVFLARFAAILPMLLC
jgi:hypothetical protein